MTVSDVPPIYITYLNRLDIEALRFGDDEVLAAVESGLAAQGRGEGVIEPRVHLEPGVSNGHFNVLRGALKAPIDLAGVKVSRLARPKPLVKTSRPAFAMLIDSPGAA